MPLNITQLTSEILTEFDNRGWDTSKAVWVEDLATAIATAVINHIESNAITTSAGDPVHTHNIT